MDEVTRSTKRRNPISERTWEMTLPHYIVKLLLFAAVRPITVGTFISSPAWSLTTLVHKSDRVTSSCQKQQGSESGRVSLPTFVHLVHRAELFVFDLYQVKGECHWVRHHCYTCAVGCSLHGLFQMDIYVICRRHTLKQSPPKAPEIFLQCLCSFGFISNNFTVTSFTNHFCELWNLKHVRKPASGAPIPSQKRLSGSQFAINYRPNTTWGNVSSADDCCNIFIRTFLNINCFPGEWTSMAHPQHRTVPPFPSVMQEEWANLSSITPISLWPKRTALEQEV